MLVAIERLLFWPYIALEPVKLDDPAITKLNPQLKVTCCAQPSGPLEIGISDCEETVAFSSLPAKTTLSETQKSQLWSESEVDIVELVDLVAHDGSVCSPLWPCSIYAGGGSGFFDDLTERWRRVRRRNTL